MENSSPKASFTITKSSLDNLLKIIKVSQTASKGKSRTCELTLTDNMVQIVAPGVNFSVPVLSNGVAKTTFEFSPFAKLIKTYDKTEFVIEIHPGYIKVENFKVPASSSFIENDKILRSIDLQINYTEFDLLLLSRDDRYTQEELDFNKISPMITDTERKLEDILNAIDKQLRGFGITKEDLKKVLEEKIQSKLQLIKSPLKS